MMSPYLADVSLHYTDGICQDVSRQPLDLLSESGTEQKSCKGKSHEELVKTLSLSDREQPAEKHTHSVCLGGRGWRWIEPDTLQEGKKEKINELQCIKHVSSQSQSWRSKLTKAHVKHAICLVKHQVRHSLQGRGLLLHMVDQTALCKHTHTGSTYYN